MSVPPNDPLRRLRRHHRVLWFIALPGLLGLGTWSMWPLERARVAPPNAATHPPATGLDRRSAKPTIEPRVFAVSLWNPVPAAVSTQPTASAPVAVPRPLKVQLIGIITNGSGKRAAIYDTDGDRLSIVPDGGSFREHTLRIISDVVVELIDGQTTRRLALIHDAGAPQ